VVARLPGPPSLQVQSAATVAVSGIQGGPFSPSSFQYQLSASSGSLNFVISGMPPWLNASFTSGSVTPSQPLIVTFTLTPAANTLGVGNYASTITFTNTTNGLGNTTRAATLTVNAPPPTCTLLGSPSVKQGQSTALWWISANAMSGMIDGGIGPVPLSGSTTVTPQQTTTYAGTFTGAGGSITCQTTVTVTAPPPALIGQAGGEFRRRNNIAFQAVMHSDVIKEQIAELVLKLEANAAGGQVAADTTDILLLLKTFWEGCSDFKNGDYWLASGDFTVFLLDALAEKLGDANPLLGYYYDIVVIAALIADVYITAFVNA
jgi:hypothetical protein